jgi:hypothetical protein
VLQLLPAPTPELEGALIEVTEVPGGVGEEESLTRHIRHLTEDGEIEGRGERRRDGRLA